MEPKEATGSKEQRNEKDMSLDRARIVAIIKCDNDDNDASK